MDTFKQSGIKVKPMYYPIIGMLSLLPKDAYSIEQIITIHEELNQQKDFKWQKDMNVILAASIFISDKLENEGLAEAS